MRVRALVRQHRFIVFTTVTLAFAGAVFALGADPMLAPFALVLAPAIAALITAALAGGGELRTLVGRIVRWRAAPLVYLAAIGLPIGGTLLIVGLALATGAPASAVFSELGPAALVVPLVVLLPALFEEFGWRGFGIPALGRLPLLWAAFLVGILFTLIHLPLHLPGQLYADLPIWPTIVTLLAYAVVLAWVFRASGGSSLLAGLMHAALNGAVPLTWGLDAARVWELRAVAFTIVAVAVVIVARRTFAAPADGAGAPDLSVQPRRT